MTRRKFSISAMAITAIAPIVTMVGCGTSTVLEILQLAVDAASAAIPIVAGALGIPAATVTLLENYLQQVSQAITGAATIIAAGGSVASIANQILALFAGIAIPDLTGLPQAIVSAIQLVAKYVAQFLANFQPAPLPITTTAKKYTVADADKAKCMAIKSKAQANIVAIAKLKTVK